MTLCHCENPSRCVDCLRADVMAARADATAFRSALLRIAVRCGQNRPTWDNRDEVFTDVADTLGMPLSALREEVERE